jgi:glycosyltransferase involved in cell wall biosynthesis
VPAAPKVTAVIATYNWAPVLPYSIGSVLDQTFTDFELLVIGDGCTDESEQVVTAVTDPRVHWINLPQNTGHQAGPNNEALRLARAGIVAHLGHDDLWFPRHLERLVAAIDAGATMAHTQVLIVHPHLVRAAPRADSPYRPGQWLSPTSVAYRRHAVVDVGGWPDRLERRVTPEAPEDDWTPEGDLWQRVALRYGAPVFVDRLTCVKIPAHSRKKVYRARPSHEQALWQSRIREAAEPELDLYAFERADAVTSFHGRAARSIEFRTRRLRRVLDRRTHAQRDRRNRRRKGLDT